MSTTFSSTSINRNFATSPCTVVLFGTFLSGYASLNASRTTANDLDAKRSSAREYTMFAPAQLWRNWSAQRPSNQSDLGSNVAEEVGREYYTGWGVACFTFCFCTAVLDRGWFAF
jgi:hypothetical protein